MNESDLHYLGGLLDGEGCFTISVGKKDGHPFGHYIRPTIAINMLAEEEHTQARDLMDELLDEAGVDVETRDDDNSQGVEVWRARASGQSAIAVLGVIESYLRLKRPQAELLLSVDWSAVRTDRDEFLKAARVRDEVRELHGGTSRSKYDYETLKSEVTEA